MNDPRKQRAEPQHARRLLGLLIEEFNRGGYRLLRAEHAKTVDDVELVAVVHELHPEDFAP